MVPNLFAKDELPGVYDAVRKDAKKAGVDETPAALWKFFLGRVRDNLHVVLCMSPVGAALRTRIMMYPSLVNCTTIDWFQTWPAEALQEVAIKFLTEDLLSDADTKLRVARVFSQIHLDAIRLSRRMLSELKRHNYVTPTHYLEL
eukprot:7709660-Prorocentrum_lima.AAC.1